MPRQARIDTPGALHHLIIRGIERKKKFYDDLDRNNFLDRLDLILTESETPCFAWALIPNHLHLLLRTGVVPIATVMRRLLTGYAVSFNNRHLRHGHLFQNRYKSILCQEDLYLLELVRYIHLNPLGARLVNDFKALDRYPYSGYSVLMGNQKRSWQDSEYILKFYGKAHATSLKRYRQFVQKGVAAGRRADLTGGGLVRSSGGWAAVKTMRRSAQKVKSDERILGDGDFVENVLKTAQEGLERNYALMTAGYDFNWLVGPVAELLNMESEDVLAPGKYPLTVKARSVLCYWAVRELGMTTVALGKKLKLAQPTISQAVARGQTIASKMGLRLII